MQGSRKGGSWPDRMDAKVSKIIALLSDPDLAEFVDRDRFARSPYFTALLQTASDHYRAHGDSGPVIKLFAAIESTRGYRARLNKFCQDAGASLVEESPLRFRKATATSVIQAKPEPARLSAGGGAGDWKPAGNVATLVLPDGYVSAAKRKASVAKTKPKKKRKRGKVDLLDSPAMYPGSFGAGKRR